MPKSRIQKQYEQLLNSYMKHASETDLYEGQQLSKSMMDQGISPEEIVGFHIEAIKKELPQIPVPVLQSFDFLLEVMIGYGFQYREHQSLREKQIHLQSELEVAAGMQQTLLPSVPQQIPNIDLGVISIAAKKMSGDYYHVYHDPKGYLGVAVADIIGKGIPAALLMSLIKYTIESLIEQPLEPHLMLGSINRVVEKNIDPHMFITMIYGTYKLDSHQFEYATAGHEPGLYYSAHNGTFYDLDVKGPVLGLEVDSTYNKFTKKIHPGDMIILFSDGLTETKIDGRFIERNELIALFNEYKHLTAQNMVETIHQELLSRSNFELYDDQTIMLMKRHV